MPSANDTVLAQPRELPLNISQELCKGRTYIVTGANVGLGLEAARHLVGVGAGKVIMAVRNLEAGETAKESIEASTGIKGVAEVWHLDLSSYASVQEFATKANETLDRIDAVIENAGVAASKGMKAEGHFLPMTVNVISTFLLAVLLLPKLKADAAKFGSTPHLSLVSSGTSLDLGELWSQIGDDPIHKLGTDEQLSYRVLYPATKLMDVLGLKELSKLLPLSRGGVVLNVLDPGLCETTLSRHAPQDFKDHLKEMWAKCGRTPECGSRTLLASAVAGKDSHGSYMVDCVPSDHKLPEWIDSTATKQAWDAIVKEIEKIKPGCVAKALE